MNETSITISWKTTKKGDRYYYLEIDGFPKYPISRFDEREDGTALIFFPCLYILKEDIVKMLEGTAMKDDIEGMRAFIERGADYGRVELVEKKEDWDRLLGNRRFLPDSSDERIDGEMVLILDKEKNEAHLAYCMAKK